MLNNFRVLKSDIESLHYVLVFVKHLVKLTQVITEAIQRLHEHIKQFNIAFTVMNFGLVTPRVLLLGYIKGSRHYFLFKMMQNKFTH